jgi:CubicO group peptidase (beta-lactamase class C family)
MGQAELKARIDGISSRWPAVGLAVGVVRNGRLEHFHGHGLADIASSSPVTQDTVFRIGPITKTFTAIAVMLLREQGLVDLDALANDYHQPDPRIPGIGLAFFRTELAAIWRWSTTGSFPASTRRSPWLPATEWR